MAKLFNRVGMRVSGTPGTGTITLSSAISNAYCTFAESGVANADVVAYFIDDGTNFEIGIGTYTAAGTTLSRDTVTLSKIAGVSGTTKLTLTSSALVYLSPRKEDLISVSETGTTGTGAVVFSTSPTFTTGITVNGTATFTPSAGLNRGFQSSHSLSGSSGADFVANSVSINADDSDVGVNAVYGFASGHTFGGAAAKGNRAAILGFLNLSASTAAANAARNYVAGDFIVQAGASDGGTGVTSATAKGAFFGIGASANITAGTNFLNITGGEFGVVMAAGTSVYYKSLIQVVGGLGDAVKGSGIDAMAVFSNQSNTVLWDDGILFAAPDGFWPIKSTGTIFRTADSGTATNGIDLSNTTFATSAFKSNGFSVGGSGAVTITGSAAFFNPAILESTSADANGGPYITLRRTSASPAANDIGGTLIWQFQNTTPAQFNGAAIQATLVDPTAGAEDVSLQFTTSVAGANNTSVMQLYQGLAVGTTSDPGLGLIYINSASFLMRTKTSWTNGAAASAGTLANAPAAGNPTKWIPVDDNGTTRYIPSW